MMKRYGDSILSALQNISPGGCEQICERARQVFASPLTWHKEFPSLISPDQDLSWVRALAAPWAQALEHFRAVLGGEFNQEIKGLLASPPAGGLTPAILKENESLKKAFWKSFEDGNRVGASAAAGGSVADGGAAGKDGSTDGPAADSMEKLKADAGQKAQDLLSQHLVTIVQAAPAATALVGMLAAQDIVRIQAKQPHMFYYDPKTALIPRCYNSQNKWQRVPMLDESEFKEFCKAVDTLPLVWLFRHLSVCCGFLFLREVCGPQALKRVNRGRCQNVALARNPALTPFA